ncbi:MAG: T9SS type A sorting domain-containing protein [Chitinophagaceae bacterium]|nr:MAG: T9SS type A sorting domain-containing protein [Chitinophagaceae bacterium]
MPCTRYCLRLPLWVVSPLRPTTLNCYMMKRSLILLLTFFVACIAQGQTVQVGTIDPTIFCTGATLSVPYTASGTFDTANVFSAELSSSSGSFGSPVVIGSVQAMVSGSISATIPTGTPTGNGYRIRVVASNPAISGSDNGTNLSINAPPVLNVSGATTICTGSGTTLVASGATQYSWSPNPMPVDADLSHAWMAVGLRLLKAGYTGPIIRLRRSSDDAEMDFGASGLHLDLAAIQTWLAGANAYCVKLYDQSGNGHDEVQNGTAQQPQFIASSVLNNRPALVFNTAQYMQMTTFVSNPYTVVYAARETGGSRGRVLSSTSNNWLLGWWSNLKATAYFEGWVSSGNTPDNSIYVYTGTGNGSTSQLYENGVQIASNSNGVYPPYGLQMNGSGLYNERSDCEFYDVVVYNTVLSPAARSAAESNLWNYYVSPNQLFVSLGAGQSGQYTVTGSTPGCTAASQTVTVTNNAIGDPSVFGNNQWNVYAWNAGTYYNDGASWNENYAGYYTATGVNFNSQSQWDPLTSPSNAPGYQGCNVRTDYFSWAAKRKGFPCGYYKIVLNSHDYYARILVNGQQVYYSCCGNTTVWTGYLTDTSTVEFGVTDDTYTSYGSLTFELVDEVQIAYPAATASTGCSSTSSLTPTITAPTGAPAGYFMALPAGLTIDSLTGVVNPSTSAVGDYTIYYIDSLPACGMHVDTATAIMNIRSSQGDPAVFGTNAWHVYGWDAGEYYDYGTSWNTRYAGYFVDSAVNHNSQNFWPYAGSPSDAANWQGCPIKPDYHSWSAKRRGFPCGYYRITLPYHDDYGKVFVNGVQVYFSCCSSGNVWTGYLNDTSTVEFRVTEGSGSSYGSITFTPYTKSIFSYPATSYCNTAGNITPAIEEAPGGVEGYFYATPAGLVIDSTTGVVNTNTSLGGDYVIHYHKIYPSNCGSDTTDVTVNMHITMTAGNPAVYGNNVWNVYGWNGGTSYNDGNSWVTNYAGFYVDTTLSMRSDSYWPSYGSPSNAPGWQGCGVNADLHSWAAKRTGFPCGFYTINVPYHDDEADLWINGVKVWGHQGCCDYHGNVWTGYLSSTDSIMFRATEGGGGSNGYIEFIRVAPAAISYPLTPYCNTGGMAPVTLTGTSGGYFYSDTSLVVNSTTGTINLDNSSVGTHTIYYVVAHAGCAPDTVSTNMEISPAPSASISYAQAAYCTSTGSVPVIRNGAGGGIYSATPAAGLNIDSTSGTIRPDLSTPGIYTVTYTVPASGDCASFANSTQVTISAPPSASITYGSGNTFCTNVDSVMVQQSGTPGGSYSISWGGLSLNPTSGTIYPSVNGTIAQGYWIYYNVGTPGCSVTQFGVVVNINQAPMATISYNGGPFYVGGNTVNVSHSGASGGTYSSSPNGLNMNTTTGSINLNLSSPGNYTVSYTIPSATCPGSTTSTTIQVLQTASAQITYNGNPFCSTEGITTVTQTGISGGTYSAQPAGLTINAGNGDININSSAPGTYTVTYFLPAGGGHGDVTATTTVTIYAPSSATIAYDATYCNSAGAANVTLTGTGGGTFSAAPGGLSINSSTGTIFPQSSAPGTYTVTYLIPSNGGCTAFSTNTTVSILPGANMDLVASQTLCNGDTSAVVTFTGGGAGTTYSWTNNNVSIGLAASGSGNTIPVFIGVNNSGGGQTATITVTPTSSNGCTGASRFFTITVLPSPLVTISGGDADSYCIGQSVTLTASAGSAYLWSTGATTQSIEVTTGGSYTVTVTNAGGCAGSASKTVTFNSNHLPSLAPTGATGFATTVMNPASGTPTTDYRFEVRYTDADGDLPQSNIIRLKLDFENDGNFNSGNDRILYMTEKDPADQNTTDGKDYYIVVNFLQASANWHTTIEATDQGGCTAATGPYAGPVVLPRVNLSIFANDITFSVPHPEVSQNIVVTANVHNNSGRDATNFRVHLRNQNDTNTVYADTVIAFLSGANGIAQVTWQITTPSVPMWCPMQVIIDYDNVLDETNELDNQAIRPFINGNYQLPGDIGITAAPSASTITANSAIAISGTAWYRNTAVQLADSSCAGATVTVKINETGQVQTVYTNSIGTYSAYFPNGPATPGTYHVTVTITDYTLEGDTTTQFSVVPQPICEAPDLSTGIDLSASTVQPQYPQSNTRYIIVGQSLTGVATEYNGGAIASGNHLLGIEVPGGSPVPGPFAVNSLSNGQSHSSNLPAITFNTVGSTYVRSIADVSGVVDEHCPGGENNNTGYQSVVVLPNAPDITPFNHYGYSIANQCQGIPIPSFGVRNIGGLPTGSFNARLTVLRNGVVETTINQTVPNINALWETSISFNSYVYPNLAGLYTFTLDCDIPDAVAEYNEGNNSTSYQIQVNACNLDLTVWGCGNVTVSPAEPTIPSTITISAQLANTSLVASTDPVTIDFNVGGAHYTTVYNGTLAAGASTTVSVNVPAPAPGNSSLIITIDPGNNITETNESNNTTTAKLCWDFQPTNTGCYGGYYIAPTQVVNTPVNMNTGLYNLGLFKATQAKVRFEVSGPGIVGWLNLGTATTSISNTCVCPLGVSLPSPYVFTQTGNYQIRITADPTGIYNECDEGNNVIFVNVNVVLPLPDYLTRSEYIAPSLLNPDLGQAIDIDISYRNDGASTTDSSTVYTKVDNDSLTQVRVPGLVTGQLNTVRMPAQWSSTLRGIHVIRAVVDKDHEINEGDEMNNEATRAVIVGKAPNLLWQSFSVSDTSAARGSSVMISGVIHNIGFEDCDAVLQLLYIDDNGQEVFIHQRNISVAEGETYNLQYPWVVMDAHTDVIARIINALPAEYNTDDNEAKAHMGGMTINTSFTQASCGSVADGSATVTISGGLAPYSIQWSNGDNTAMITVAPGTYSVAVTDAAGNTQLDTVTVTSAGTGCNDITSSLSSNSNCSGTSLPVTYTASGTFLAGNQFIAQLSAANGSFSSPVTIGSVSATTSGTINCTIPANTPAGSGYLVRVVSTMPSVTEASGHSLTIFNPASASINYSGGPFCNSGGTAVVTQSGTSGGSYTAAPAGLAINSATGDINLGGSLAGTYTVTYTVASGNPCGTFTTSTSITINAAPAATISYEGPFCPAGTASATINGTGGGTFSSTAGLSLNAGTGAIDLAASVSGTYTVFYTISASGVCPQLQTSTSVTIYPRAVVDDVADMTTHNGATTTAVNFTGTPGGITYQWTNSNPSIGLAANGTGNLPSFTAMNPGMNPVTATITVTPVFMGGDLPCYGDAKTFTITVNPFTITTLTYPGSPYCARGNGVPDLQGQNGGVFTSTAGLSISPATGVLNLAASTPGTYTVTYSFTSYGQPGTASATVIVSPLPTINTVSNQLVCGNTMIAINFSGTGTSYTWTNDNPSIGLAASGTGNIGSFLATNNGSGNVIANLVATAVSGSCTSTPVSFRITVKPAPTVSLPANTTVCAGTATPALNFTGSVPGAVYAWTNNNTATGIAASGSNSIPSFNAVNNTGVNQTSTIVVTPAANSCTGTAQSFTFTVAPAPGSISFPGSPFCITTGPSLVTRTGSSGGTFSATPAGLTIDASTGTITPGSSATGTYTVTYTVGAGGGACGNTATTQVVVNTRPTVNTIGNQVTCPGSSTLPIAFSGTGATSYTWTNNTPAIGLAASGSGNSLPAFVATNNTTANLNAAITVTAIGNCPGNSITFRYTVYPQPVMNQVATQSYCRGVAASAVTFSSPVAGSSYNWSHSNTGVGLSSSSGWGNIPGFTTQNATAGQISSLVTVIPYANKCPGTPMQFSYVIGNCVAQAGETGGDGSTSRLASQVTVGPNPTQNQVTIWYTGNSAGPRTVELLDQYGRTLIKPASFSGGSYTLSLIGLTSGTYVVRVVDSKTKESVERKVIKL